MKQKSITYFSICFVHLSVFRYLDPFFWLSVIWWRLFQISIVETKLDIYVFITWFTNLFLYLFNEDCQQPMATSGFPDLQMWCIITLCNNIIFDWQISKNFHNNYLISYNLFLTDADEELFEDNPDEYIRRDIEGSGGLHINKWVMNMEWYLTWSYIAV